MENNNDDEEISESSNEGDSSSDQEEKEDMRPNYVRISDNLKKIKQTLKGDNVAQGQISEAIKFIYESNKNPFRKTTKQQKQSKLVQKLQEDLKNKNIKISEQEKAYTEV